MSPLYDQDGKQTDEAEVRLDGAMIDRVVVEHDEITFFVNGAAAFVVSRPTHPGAGLALDIAEWVEKSS